VVGVQMRVEHVANTHAHRLGGPQVRGKVAKRIDYGRGGVSAAAEEVRRRNGIGVEKLAQDHRLASYAGLDNSRKPQAAQRLDKASLLLNYSIE
jgi:hypothetical protein